MTWHKAQAQLTKSGPASPTPLVGRPVPSAFPKTIFTMCQSKSVRGVSNVGKAVEQLNLATLTPPIKTLVLPLAESVKKVRFSYL
jgi:hypothetical protein